MGSSQGVAALNEAGSGDHIPDRHWFEDLADHMGPAYLRYSFTRGTEGEVDFLIERLGLVAEHDGEKPSSVLDLGCGPGRHCIELARRGIRSVGTDISTTFVEVAQAAAQEKNLSALANFVRSDVTDLPQDLPTTYIGESHFDAVIAMCQGGFGIADPTRHHPGEPAKDLSDPFNLDHDRAVLSGVHRMLKPGGLAAISAFSGYFQARWIEETDTFDPRSGINHEITEVMDSDGAKSIQNLWTTCYTPRELALLASEAELDVVDVFSVAPGGYVDNPPNLESQEFLLLASKPA